MVQFRPQDTLAAAEWKRIGVKAHHGFDISLLSLRNPQGSGVGEILDLIPMIEWAKSIGFDTIQLLPLNDSGDDPSPYMALSAMAIHPIYISLYRLPNLDQTLQQQLQALQLCNSSQRANYPYILATKLEFLRSYYEKTFSAVSQGSDWQAFLQEHDWLDNYARFKALKTKNNERPWWEWDKITNTTLASLTHEANFHKYLQYLAFSQWKKVMEAANTNSVFIKGDIPILISRDSADVWQHPELFLLQYAAGAPPDMYSKEGQYWGFPIYNWDAMENRGYKFWKERLKTAENLYHIYRIDHVVGFYRIWAIPLDHKATEGFFIPQDESTWIQHGNTILSMMLGSCSMLPIAEDLGVVPPEARMNLSQLGIPGTKVMRWERRWNEDRSYILPKDYPELSMTTISTHDSETLAEWWQTANEDVVLFSKTFGISLNKKLSSDSRFQILDLAHKSNSLFHINLLQEYLALYPELCWPKIEDERINVPGTITPNNWTYRFKPTIDEIIQHKPLQESMKKLSMHSPSRK